MQDVLGNTLSEGDKVVVSFAKSQLKTAIVVGFTPKKVLVQYTESPNFTEHKFPAQVAFVNSAY